MKPRVVLAFLILTIVAVAVEAGSKASKACNMCRKEKNPRSSKFPTGYSSCSDYYGSAQCPVTNTDTGNNNPTGYAGPQPDCHTDPYTQNCPKKEQKYPDKYNSNVNQSDSTSAGLALELAGGLLIVAFVFMMIMIIAQTRSSSNQQPQNIVINSNYNVAPDPAFASTGSHWKDF